MKLLLTLLFFSVLTNQFTYGYETMIRHGYANCMTCHQSTTGAGLLNSYGKVIASQISTFGSKKMPNASKYNHALQVRMAHLRTNGEVRNFPMQFDYLAAIKHENFFIETTLAKAPRLQDGKSDENITEQFYLRKALFSYKFHSKLFLQFGRDYLDVGLNLIDHTLLVRRNNKRSVTDFQTIIRAPFYSNDFKISPFFFAPSFQENDDDKEYGVGVKAEKYFTSQKTVVSLTALAGKTKAIKRKELAFTFKKGFKSFVILGQIDFTRRVLQSETAFNQGAYLLGLSFFPIESLELKANVEKLKINDPFSLQTDRLGHGFVYKPVKNISFQYDAKRVTNTKSKYQSIFQVYLNGFFL